MIYEGRHKFCFKLSIQSVRRGRKWHEPEILLLNHLWSEPIRKKELVILNLKGVPGLSGWTVLLSVFPKR